jgi:nitroreductase
MARENPVFDALMARRSGNARALAMPAPSPAEIAAIVTAGSRAPDHGRLVPFRFIDIADEGRARLADLMEAAQREIMPDAPAGEIERTREKAHQGPALLALVARIDAVHPKIIASDQWLTVGCALENMLLAIQSLGYAAAVRSGKIYGSTAMRAGFGLAPNEHLTCLIAIGTPTDWPPQKPKPELAQVFSRWVG